jgi:hypothetical protein
VCSVNPQVDGLVSKGAVIVFGDASDLPSLEAAFSVSPKSRHDPVYGADRCKIGGHSYHLPVLS